VAFYPVVDVAQLQHEVLYKSVPGYVDVLCGAQTLRPMSPPPSVVAMTSAVLLIHGARGDHSPLSQRDAMLGLQTIGQQAERDMLEGAGQDFMAWQFDHAWPWVVMFLARHQMFSVAWRSPEQQKRVNLFTERGWFSRLGARGITTVRALGPITKERVVVTANPHITGRKDELREFVFDGLYVRALFPGRAHDAYLLQQVRITKRHWKTRFGLNVGTIRSSIVQVLGKPDSEKSNFVEYSHSMGIGTVRIWMIEDHVTELEWQFRAD
jgi:hypothetical protein